MLDHAKQIKSMKLYTHIERVMNELAELGKTENDALTVAELNAFDQMHYHGTTAVDYAINAMQINPGSKVLEIGSGFGGCARHLAATSGAHITALELQPDQDQLAGALSARCGLSDRVQHACGDFLDNPLQGRNFDHIVSWLAIFHIPDRIRLLQISKDLLNTGGMFFAEDMYCRREMEADEHDELATGMYAAYLPDFDQYKKDFTESGFEIIECEDMSDNWTDFTSERLQNYRDSRERQIRVHDEETFQAMEEFYDLVNRHFRSGKLGGVRILARKLGE